jgi:hypothetical protein
MPRGMGLTLVKISFEKVKDMTLGQLYGTGIVSASDLTKKLWELIKKENLRLPKGS